MENAVQVLTCYKCDDVAVSVEHVPPKCLFPEAKDVGGLNFKKDLITVPSCYLHNMAKSQDDEFLMISMAGIIHNNDIGLKLYHTKVDRALRRKERGFLNKQILQNLKYKKIKINDDKFTIAAIGLPNYDRLEKCFEAISEGLFYHKFKKIFKGKIVLILNFIEYLDENSQTLKRFIKKRFELEDLLESVEGRNPEVFYYQFCKPDSNGLIALKMVFYGANEVYVSFKPENTKVPFDLAMKMLNNGMHTSIELGNEIFEFNK